MNRRALLSFLALGAVAFGPAAMAAEAKFDQKAFDAAQVEGKPIMVHVTAPWCPTCKAQAPILSRLESEPRFKDMVRFNIDFDSQKDLLKRFGVQKQSTLIAFKAGKETGRSVGDTSTAGIEALFKKAMN